MTAKTPTSALAACMFFLFASPLFSQNDVLTWEQMMLNPAYNFFQVRDAFYQEWAGKPYQSGNGYKQFKRWEYWRETTVDSNGHYPADYYWQEHQRFLDSFSVQGASKGAEKSMAACADPNVGGDWSALGPFNEPNGNNGIGRINTIAFHPSDPNTFWAGSPAGGLWKTTTGGTSWTTNTDNFTNLGVGDIAYNPLDPNIMYMGTGDRDHSDTYAYGLLKSTDGGTTWTATSLSIGSNNLIHRVLVNPSNPNIVLVATSTGLWRSLDAGATWTKMNTLYFRHLEFKPTDPTIVYATTYSSSKFYRSTDSGATFSLITLPAPSSGSTVTRFSLAVTAADPTVVYIMGAFDDPAGSNDFNGLFKSTNSGVSFTQLTVTTVPTLGSQSWYDWTLAVSPTNANEIYAGGVGLRKSTNGGVTWSSTGSGVHVDHHFAGFQPGTNAIFVGSDGGVFKSTNNGTSWTDHNNGLHITQYYRLGASSLTQNLVLTGAQDNGTHLLIGSAWEYVFGGDGMECLTSHNNDNVMFASYQNGYIMKSTDGGGNFPTTAIDPAITGESGAWVTPYVMDPSNPNTLWAGYKSVWKSVNQGTTWTNSSGALTTGNFQHIAVAPSNGNIVYATDYNQIWKTTNGGTSWATVTDPGSSIRYMAIHNSDPNIVWICRANDVLKTTNGGTSWTDVSGTLPNIPMRSIVHQPNANNAVYVGTEIGIYFKNDLLTNWQPFSDNLPNVIVNELQIFMPTGKIRAATFGRGLWESDLYCNDGIVCTNTVTAYPHSESFETSLGLWVQETTDGFDWTQQSGPTPTANTGPTAAAAGNFYLYAEADEHTGQEAILRSPCLNLGNISNPALYFAHHLFGSQIGTLSVQVSTDFGVNWTTVWTLSGNQGDVWNEAVVNLVPYASQGLVSVRFKALVAGVEGDIAVDDFYIGEGCGTPISTYPYTESFENGIGAWTQSTADDIDWIQDANDTPTANTGPPTAYDGTYYMYVESSAPNFPAKVAILTGPCFDLDGLANPTLTFARHMYGATMGTLAVEISLNGGKTWQPTPIWTLSGNQGNAWALVSVSLSAYTGQVVKFRFKGTTGTGATGDMAIDKVSVANDGTLPPSCTNLTSPAPGATGVASTASLTWTAATGSPTGYRLDVGTTSGGTNILNNFDVGNVTTFDPPGNFPNSATIFVKIKPYNANGTNLTCNEQSFSTILGNPSACQMGMNIPDNSCTAANRFNIEVANAPGTALGTDVFLANAKIIVEHTWVEDLDIKLYAPDGTVVELSTDNGGSGDNFGNPADATCTQVTNFNMSAGTAITTGTPPYIGSFVPEGNFSSFNNGTSPVGTWVLELCDDVGDDGGQLEFVELVFATLPNCTSLTAPLNGAANVPVTAALSWTAATGNPAATGYRLDVGTTPGGTDILNNVDVGNMTTYNPAGDFPAGAVIFVKIKPYNAFGTKTSCVEESFGTELPPPSCTSLTSPINGAIGVLTNALLTWAPATGNPTGYRLDIGTTPGGTDILNNEDVGNMTVYDPAGDFPFGTTVFVKIKPYNGTGSATGCVEESFSTQVALPFCTSLSSPANGSANVAVTAALTWAAAAGLPTGYRLDLGTTPGGTDILDNEDVGNVTTYDPAGNFAYSTTMYVKIKPYNGTGSATGCAEESFTTEAVPLPSCTSLTSPVNAAIGVPINATFTWAAASGIPTGYRLDLGTTPGGTDILNNEDVGDVTTYDPAGDFPYSTTVFVKIKPYNGSGSATGCTEESFTTEAAPLPSCTSLTSPVNSATSVPANAVLTWAAAAGLPTGYRLDLGTTPGGTDILNNEDVGNVTVYDPTGYLPYGATIYVTIKPYNANGPAIGCVEESFGTGNCIPNLVIVSVPVPEGTYRSLGDLLSNNSTIALGTVVTFTSDTGVLLDQNFVVEEGGVFEVNIQTCTVPEPIIPVDDGDK